MTKEKVGAEPKKKRVAHKFTQGAGIHEGIHRDEWGYFDSNYHPYCFAYGYFFHRGKSLGEKLTPDYIKDNWDRELWCNGIGEACMAVVDRKRKIAVIKQGTEYDWQIEKSLPCDYKIYFIDESIPVYDITSPKQRKLLIKTHLRYLIKQYLDTHREEFKILNSISKVISYYGNYGSYYDSYIVRKRNEYRNQILDIMAANKWLPKYKPLSDKTYFVSKYKVVFPSLDTIVQQNLFNEEERIKIQQCLFYSKYCYNRNIPWKDVVKNWSIEWKEKIIKNDEADAKAFKVRAKKFIEISKRNEAKAKEENELNLETWRKGERTTDTHWVDYYIDYTKRTITPINRIICKNFQFTQLRLKPSRLTLVETSHGAIVPLEAAINLFNILYKDYMLSGKTEFYFKHNKFKVGSFELTHMEYVRKPNYANCYVSPTLEWRFQIGCHSLWFDDIKDFAKYYNLQNRLSFPLDKTTAECIEHSLIHLPSGRTIQAIGVSGVLDK
uniref:Uncharacterized protein n=1 Tax=Geladintestivirus 4 TaxID=3233136 RepID=A0AAU8MHG3_9CAUD